MTTLFIIILVLFLLGCIAIISLLLVGIPSINEYELKLMARSGNKDAKIVYPYRKMGYRFTVTLLICYMFLIAAITAVIDTKMYGLVAVFFTTLLVLLIGQILPMAYLKNYGLMVAARTAPILRYLVTILSPLAKPLAKLLDKWLGDGRPKIYSKAELYKIFEDHKISEHSDIEESTVQIVRHALNFGDKQVREVMTPRRIVVAVSADDSIGPILIDELHASGYSRFPVYNDKKTQNFIGTLYLHDLVNLKVKSGESVKDVMRKAVYYVHEEESLGHALNVFLKTNHHLLVVVNTFEEFVGVVSFEDVIEEIIGKQIVDEFDQHEDLRAVAKSLADKEKKIREDKLDNK
jgi:metal transporter CNNM